MNNRPVASLSPTLLARKGGARPAMRPQLQPLRAFQDNAARQLDDLGWNDMGHDVDAPDDQPQAEMPAEVEQADAPQTADIVAIKPGGERAAAIVPHVVLQQEKIAERLAPERLTKGKSQPRRSALSQGRKAAFTLRLDAERHLKLRLACVTSNRSAQQLVTEALDRLIADLPQVDELAGKVRKGAKK